jgi:hypothetical protein
VIFQLNFISLVSTNKQMGRSFNYDVHRDRERFVVTNRQPVADSDYPNPRYTRIITRKTFSGKTYLYCKCDMLSYRIPCRHVLAINRQRCCATDFHFRHSLSFSIIPVDANFNARCFEDREVLPSLLLTEEEIASTADVFEVDQLPESEHDDWSVQYDDHIPSSAQDKTNRISKRQRQMELHLKLMASFERTKKTVAESLALTTYFLQQQLKLEEDVKKAFLAALSLRNSSGQKGKPRKQGGESETRTREQKERKSQEQDVSALPVLSDPQVLLLQETRPERFASYATDKPGKVNRTRPKRKKDMQDVLDILGDLDFVVSDSKCDELSEDDQFSSQPRIIDPDPKKPFSSTLATKKFRRETLTQTVIQHPSANSSTPSANSSTPSANSSTPSTNSSAQKTNQRKLPVPSTIDLT